MLLLAVAIVGFSYLVTVISISTRGYKMRDLEYRADDLKLENKKLNLEIAQMQSPARIEEWVKTSGMVSAGNVRYVSATTGVVAAR